VVAFAWLGLIVLGHVSLHLQFVHSVRKGTRIFKLAAASGLPILADFRFILHLERLLIFVRDFIVAQV
jgi:hypothetical protein